jgi:hypothetical protein
MTGPLVFDSNYPLTDKQRNEILIALYNAAVGNESPLVTTHTGSSNETITVNGSRIGISNDGATDLTVTVNGIISTIQAGEMIGPSILNFGSFTGITVTTTSAYRLWVYA